MLKLFESIRCENGIFENLLFHQARMNYARRVLFGCKINIDLTQILLHYTKNAELHGLNKCRLIYSKMPKNVEVVKYQIPRVNSLKLISNNDIEYSYKLLERTAIDQLFRQRGDCDDVLIIKNGLITDTSYANILFFDGNEWLTPENPLLPGTRRAALLEEKRIKPANIRIEDLEKFEKARLINAMLRFEDKVDIRIKHIRLD